jgi:iron-sulfur cluster repair protein YtfE (RIC family)
MTHIDRSARRLHDDHVDFELRFDDLMARALMGDWRDLDEAWSSFASDLCDHLAFEERAVFPVCAEQDKECRRLVAKLTAEHDTIRELLDEIGVSIQTHEVRAYTIAALVQVLREHAALENARIYPRIRKAAEA